MKISILVIGKTDNKQLIQLIESYQKRLQHYVKFSMEVIPDIKNVKNLSKEQQKEKEGELILLDEKGKEFRSLEFANYLQKKMNTGLKRLVFVVGGPYGFSDAVYKKSQEKVSLSQMTFSHQMIRLFIVEQIYRAFTILKNEPYHHE